MSFFKAYDMRGTFGVDFDLALVERVGRELPRVIGGTRWLVGRDCRTTGADVEAALVRGLAAAGADVTELGLCTTPMVYFFTAADGYDGSVMVTASHNPPGDNGLKVSRAGAVPVGFADGLDQVKLRVEKEELRVEKEERRVGRERGEAAAATLNSQLSTFNSRYIAWQRAAPPGLRGLNYAVDCSNGMAALLARDLFPGARILNETLDGRFPNHSPNPLTAEARAQLAAVVRAEGLDCGVIFDGDADRAMFVDERGAFVQPDYLIPVVARASVPAGRRAKILHDVRTSRGAIEAIRALGLEPVMVPVGHVFAKKALRACGAACGGELAGHYYFSEFYNCDSGVLAARRILGEIARAKAAGRTFSEMMAPIATRYANSGELNFKVADKKAAIARVLAASAAKLPRETGRATMDGLRLEFAEGWINIRESNTEPYLRLVAECDTAARLAEWRAILTDAITGG